MTTEEKIVAVVRGPMKHQSAIQAIESNVRLERRRDVERVRSGESAAKISRENGAFGLGLLKRGGVNWHQASRAFPA